MHIKHNTSSKSLKHNQIRIIKLTQDLVFSTLFSVILSLTSCQTPTTDHEESDVRQKEALDTSLSIAASYLDGRRPDKAMHELKTILDKYPNNIEALNLMGITQLALSNPGRAVAFLEKAWRMQAQPGTGVNLSSAYIETDRFKDAEKILSQFIKQRKNLSYDHPERIYHNYGLLAEKTNRSVLAESMFKKAVEENPMFYMSHMQLVRIYRDKRKPSLLQKQLEAARFACPICYEPMADLVELHNQKGDILTARQLIQDYKLTEGVAQADRKRLLILENRLIELAKRQTQDAAQKNR